MHFTQDSGTDPLDTKQSEQKVGTVIWSVVSLTIFRVSSIKKTLFTFQTLSKQILLNAFSVLIITSLKSLIYCEIEYPFDLKSNSSTDSIADKKYKKMLFVSM